MADDLKRSGGERLRRSSVFILSIWLNALGVALVTVAALGTTPISSIWYEISLHVPLTFGTVTFIGNFILICSQFFLVKDHSIKQLLSMATQLPTTLIFAASIDLNMLWLQAVLPEISFYPLRFALLLAGTLILGLGVAAEVKADVALVAGEAFVKALCLFLHREFGIIKLCFDVSLVLGAVAIGLIATDFTEVASVREGTLVGALMVGPCVRIILPRLSFLDVWFKGRRAAAAEKLQALHGWQPVITISREYGCGGRVLGHMLADALKLDFYDSSIIEMVAKESGMSAEFVKRHENRIDNALLFEMLSDYSTPVDKSLSTVDALYTAGARVIKRLARHSPCVIVGRGADALLADNPRCLKVRLQASPAYKLNYCLTEYKLAKEQALKDMTLFDKRRAEHYLHYTGRQVNDAANYDLVLNVEALGLDGCVKIISDAYSQLLARAAQLEQEQAEHGAPADQAAS